MKKSSGILIYRKKNGKIQVFLVHPGGPFWRNKDLNSWSIPKGEITQADFLDHADKRRLNNTQIDADTNIRVNPRVNPRESALLNTALREFEEETGIVLTDEDKEKIFYLGEVKSKKKIVYVFALEKDLGDEIKIKSNLVRRGPTRTSRGPTQTKNKNKFIEFPEIDKGEYFDLEVAKEKLVSYQKELIEMIKLC
jgi:predicted NUDIX family NTP pyrophosphohydrolase